MRARFSDHGQFGFILNLEHAELEETQQQELALGLHEINESLQQQHGVSLQFAVGRSGSLLDGIHLSYAEVKRMMNYKALFNKSDVVFVQEVETDHRMEYPLAVQKELAHHIMAADHSKANESVTGFMKTYVQKSGSSRERLLEMIIMLISGTMNDLYQEGYDAFISMNLLELNSCRNNEELEAFIRRFVEELIGKLERQRQESSTYSLYIAKAIEYIEMNYQSNISVTDIADHVGLSGSYLSRVFKAETGKPPLEYLSRHRIMRSKELLQHDVRSSMQEVSQAVGYHDAHSFIRFFKKYEGLTPGEYRKKLLEKKDPVQPG
ncbi:helix-turn-helix domain-containing protein [Paenibacillus sp. TAB 01]|uniref:AraC family transcriptional regulator n=1 Tax=Paenibacillus sp. TAB 01 TaxID=3368988 RepID=UPI0037502569